MKCINKAVPVKIIIQWDFPSDTFLLFIIPFDFDHRRELFISIKLNFYRHRLTIEDNDFKRGTSLQF